MNSIMFHAKERAIAENGDGLADDPVHPEPPSSPDNTARKVMALGEQVRARKVQLKTQGWTGQEINDDNSIRRFVDELSAIKTALPEESLDAGTALFYSADSNGHPELGKDWLCYNEPDAHTLQLRGAALRGACTVPEFTNT